MELFCGVGGFSSVRWEDKLQEGIFDLMFAYTDTPKESREECAGVLEEFYDQEKEEVYSTTLNDEYGEYEYKRPTRTKVMLLGVASGAVDEGIEEFHYIQ